MWVERICHKEVREQLVGVSSSLPDEPSAWSYIAFDSVEFIRLRYDLTVLGSWACYSFVIIFEFGDFWLFFLSDSELT